MTTETHVIVGAGLAGAKAAEELRAKGCDGRARMMATAAPVGVHLRRSRPGRG